MTTANYMAYDQAMKDVFKSLEECQMSRDDIFIFTTCMFSNSIVSLALEEEKGDAWMEEVFQSIKDESMKGYLTAQEKIRKSKKCHTEVI